MPELWGVINVTPDSFSDGGRHLDPDAAIAHGRALLEHGADVLDIGGESSRPAGQTYGDGFEAVSAKYMARYENAYSAANALVDIDGDGDPDSDDRMGLRQSVVWL